MTTTFDTSTTFAPATHAGGSHSRIAFESILKEEEKRASEGRSREQIDGLPDLCREDGGMQSVQ